MTKAQRFVIDRLQLYNKEPKKKQIHPYRGIALEECLAVFVASKLTRFKSSIIPG